MKQSHTQKSTVCNGEFVCASKKRCCSSVLYNWKIKKNITVITLCFRTPFVFGHPLFFIEIIFFDAQKHVFFGNPLFSVTPIFHRNKYFQRPKT